MKKFLKFIPLLLLPIALSSCVVSNANDNSIKATELRISSESLVLGYGRTATISAAVNPKEAKQEINWKTSNASVASLSKTKTTEAGEEVVITAGTSDGEATITATSVDGKFVKTCQVSVQAVSGSTVMIYMCGSDLESDGYLATADLKEILSVNNQPSNVNIVIQTGGATKWSSKYGISASKSQRWEVRNKKLNKVSEKNKVDMSKQSTLQDFVTWGLQNYPAEKYGLILWNHGGAMDGVCFDDQFNQGREALLADEVYNAVKNARETVGMSAKLDWISYDACLMAVQDVAEYNSYNFNYMLSSQESESGEGYDYDAWLPTLYSNPNISGADLLPVIGRTFMEDQRAAYQNELGSSWTAYFDQTQSVYDLSKIGAYKEAFEDFANSLYGIAHGSNSNLNALNTALNNSQQYGYDLDAGYTFGVYDVNDALTRIKAKSAFNSLASKVTTVSNALNDLVIYEEHGQATSGCGVCLFVPDANYGIPYDRTVSGYVGPHSNFTNWKKVANDIWNYKTGY